MTSDETRPDLRFCTCGAEAGHAGSERCPLAPPRLLADENASSADRPDRAMTGNLRSPLHAAEAKVAFYRTARDVLKRERDALKAENERLRGEYRWQVSEACRLADERDEARAALDRVRALCDKAKRYEQECGPLDGPVTLNADDVLAALDTPEEGK